MRPVLLAILVLLAVTSGANAAPRQDPDGFTPIVQRVVAPPWPVKGSDGRFHLVYEVQLLNTIPVPWRVTGVTVRSTRGRGRALASWRGPRVRDVMRSLADGRDTRRVGPGEGALLHLTFSARRRGRLPRSLVHELRLANLDPGNSAPRRAFQIGARAKLVGRAPAVLGPPLQGDRWLAADGCCLARRHVRAFQPSTGRRRPAIPSSSGACAPASAATSSHSTR